MVCRKSIQITFRRQKIFNAKSSFIQNCENSLYDNAQKNGEKTLLNYLFILYSHYNFPVNNQSQLNSIIVEKKKKGHKKKTNYKKIYSRHQKINTSFYIFPIL